MILILSQLGWAEVSQVYISQQVGDYHNFSILYENGKVNEIKLKRLPFNLIVRYSEEKDDPLIFLIANYNFTQIQEFKDKKFAFQWGDIGPNKVAENNWLKSMELKFSDEKDFVFTYNEFINFRTKNKDLQNVNEFKKEIDQLDNDPVMFWGDTRIQKPVGGISTQTINSLNNLPIENYTDKEIIFYIGDRLGKETKMFHCIPVRLLKCKLILP